MTPLETGLRAAFQAANERQAAGLDALLALYHAEVYFEDPLQRTHGKEAFAEAMRRMYRKLKDIEFQLQSFSEAGDEAHATWTMRFRPPFGPRIILEGATHLRLRDGKILYHRDYWDLLSSLLDTSPLTALAYRAISRRFVLSRSLVLGVLAPARRAVNLPVGGASIRGFRCCSVLACPRAGFAGCLSCALLETHPTRDASALLSSASRNINS